MKFTGKGMELEKTLMFKENKSKMKLLKIQSEKLRKRI